LEEVILRCLAYEPEDRFASVEELIAAFEKAKAAQLNYYQERAITSKKEFSIDWSSDALESLNESDFHRAENIAQTEFQRSGDPQAFLMMISAASKDGRFFDVRRELDAHAELLTVPSPVHRQLQEVALKAFLETRAIDRASELADTIIHEHGETPTILLKKASILGLLADYEGARDILLRLNREFPGRPAVLRRLVVVFEQLRDIGKASAFLKAYQKAVPNDQWATKKVQDFVSLGFR